MSVFDSTLILICCIISSVVIGVIVGSFLNCVALRISRGESFLKRRSRCPFCGHVLGAFDLFPIFSWVFLRGKCRYCKSKISARYPITEAIMAICSMLCLLAGDFSWLTLRNWIFICVLFLLSLVDLEIYEIPNLCIIIPIVVWGASLPLMQNPVSLLKSGLIAGFSIGAGMLLIAFLLDKILKKESLGDGDVKLFFVMGLYLGVMRSLFAIVFACIAGLIYVVIKRRGQKEKKIPFGPSIAFATFIMLLYGTPLAQWYSGLLV